MDYLCLQEAVLQVSSLHGARLQLVKMHKVKEEATEVIPVTTSGKLFRSETRAIIKA